MNSLNFTVHWSADEVSDYDVQMKIGNGAWQNWLTDVSQKSKSYTATKDFTLYKFRARAGNDSGSHSEWTEIEAPIASLPVVINEVMYNPNPGSDDYYEYIELYNLTDWDIDLEDWILISDGSSIGDLQTLSADIAHSGSSTVIKAGGYAIIGDETVGANHIFDNVYYQIPAYSENVIRLEIDDAALGLRNDLSQAWITLKNKNGVIIDKFAYSKDWNWAQGNGKAIEKLNPLRFSESKDNWGEGLAGGTPGAQNSNYSATALNYLPASYTVVEDAIFSPFFGTYVVDDSLTVGNGVELVLEPGTIFKFKYSSSVASRGKMIINGAVLAEGTPSQPIVFTSSRDMATDFTQPATNNPAYYGDWNYIEINSTGDDSVFDNIIVRYGGVAMDTILERGAFRILGEDVTVKNSLFDNNRVAGIYLNNASGSSLENLVLRNHTATYGNNNLSSVAVWVRNGGLPTLNNLQITNNSYGVYWPGGNCTNLIDNATIIFSQNGKNTECGCCPL